MSRGIFDVSPERERFAEALWIEQSHGEAAAAFIAERISGFAQAGDEVGVQRWLQIAAKLDQLQARGQTS